MTDINDKPTDKTGSDASDVDALVSFKVTEKAMRPASKKRECFYCQQSIGEAHKSDCVLIKKKVKVIMLVEYEVEVPASWDKNQIESHRNEGSWCSNNAIDELKNIFDNGDSETECMCSYARFECLGGDTEPFLDEK